LFAGQELIIGQHPDAVLPLCSSTDAIQNGAPDVIALYVSGTLIQSVEYASNMTSSICDMSMTSALDSSGVAGSIQLCLWPNDWVFTNNATPGEDNDCQ
jgi:hypothetical protein